MTRFRLGTLSGGCAFVSAACAPGMGTASVQCKTPRESRVLLKIVFRPRERKLLESVEPEAEPGLLAAGGGFLDHARFDALVKTGDDGAQRNGGFIFFSAGEGGGVFFFQRVETRFDAGVAGLLAGAAAHAAFG